MKNSPIFALKGNLLDYFMQFLSMQAANRCMKKTVEIPRNGEFLRASHPGGRWNEPGSTPSNKRKPRSAGLSLVRAAGLLLLPRSDGLIRLLRPFKECIAYLSHDNSAPAKILFAFAVVIEATSSSEIFFISASFFTTYFI